MIEEVSANNLDAISLKIIETPRDGFQGIPSFIPTTIKTEYINRLFKAGFDTIEVGSFVSPKAIPQMKDTAEVLDGLDLSNTSSKVMVLIGNIKGGKEVVKQEKVDILLFPFALSETFLNKNINSSFDKSKEVIRELQELAAESNKEFIVYLSMGFGNPYGDPWSVGFVRDMAGYLYEQGFRVIPLADVLGSAGPDLINDVYSTLVPAFPDVEFGIHLHTTPDEYYDKVDAACTAGVRRFDTVLGGIGGCPMTDKVLVGNLNTLSLVEYCEKNGIEHGLDKELLLEISGKYSF
jgi:hydroxymethylglutaryl-CoA lyase